MINKRMRYEVPVTFVPSSAGLRTFPLVTALQLGISMAKRTKCANQLTDFSKSKGVRACEATLLQGLSMKG